MHTLIKKNCEDFVVDTLAEILMPYVPEWRANKASAGVSGFTPTGQADCSAGSGCSLA